MNSNEKESRPIIGANQITDRDITKVSTDGDITLSEPCRVFGRLIRSETSPVTGYAILREEKKNRPESEDAIRGLI
ncbi:MAG TPA: hypothetical protein VN429_05010 [Methanospirillum sp.]|uniref:hypothetical protein n=1 Tax=Methanospirillum sp. TaxID=45200 RepID=UPI002C3692FB|nr:hypothetical protein [Methanospirillum sp.]HWQ63755.1 hypothetical protein [Methanospirillum sp.]